MAIHAGKSIAWEAAHLFHCQPYQDLFAERGYMHFQDFPRGCVLGVALVLACHSIADVNETLTLEDLMFGDFSDGWFAWELAHVLVFQDPVPAVGRQRIWNWDVPEKLETTVACWKRRCGLVVPA